MCVCVCVCVQEYFLGFYGISIFMSHLMPNPVYICLFGFNGIPTFVGYLMENPFFFTNKLFYFKQFSLDLVNSLIVKNISISSYSVFSNIYNSNYSV